MSAVRVKYESADFFNRVGKLKPREAIVIKGALVSSQAYRTWDFDYFAKQLGHIDVPIKSFRKEGINVSIQKLGDYIASIQGLESSKPDPSLPYTHDIPMFRLCPDLKRDVDKKILGILPSWYHNNWGNYAQFFVGPKHSFTPLHFDCLLTHNIFFQVHGRKVFNLISWGDRERCYRYDWRWFRINTEQPDLERYPSYEDVAVTKVVLEAGDALYMPPGTLHSVYSLDPSISFNFDFHTHGSALKGMAYGLRGMPLQNVYYNSLIALGLNLRVPEPLIYSLYRSYLNYIS